MVRQANCPAVLDFSHSACNLFGNPRLLGIAAASSRSGPASKGREMFAANVPLPERLVRIILGLAIAFYACFGLPQPSLLMAALGLCVTATGLVGFCPACALVGRRLKSKR